MAQVVMTIDRDENHTRMLEKHLQREMAMGVVQMQNAADALRHVVAGSAPQPDVVLMRLGARHNTHEVLRALRSLRPDLQVIILATLAEVDEALHALSEGAADFLLMPFHAAQLTAAIRNALIRRDLQMEARHAWASERIALEDFRAESAALGATLFLARKLADTDAPLLLEGAPGTGRELLARAMHGSSRRREAPFQSINLSLFLPQEMEKKIFGDAERAGVLAKAQQGTVLLRNIDVLPEALLQRLQEVLLRKTPICAASPLEYFDARVMFAVQDASKRESGMVEQRVSQLFSKLNALPLGLPYLRDIPEDIPFLATQLCRRYAALEGRPVLGIAAPALQMLREISWPGNMEQLALGIYNAVMCCEGNELVIADFRHLFRPQSTNVEALPTRQTGDATVQESSPDRALEQQAEGLLRCLDTQGNVKRLQDVEQEMIRYALERYSGHMSAVAKHLGIGRSTLYRKISTMDDGK